MMYSFFLRYAFVLLGFLARFLMRHHVRLTAKGEYYETMAAYLYYASLMILLCADASDDTSMHSDCILVTA